MNHETKSVLLKKMDALSVSGVNLSEFFPVKERKECMAHSEIRRTRRVWLSSLSGTADRNIFHFFCLLFLSFLQVIVWQQMVCISFSCRGMCISSSSSGLKNVIAAVEIYSWIPGLSLKTGWALVMWTWRTCSSRLYVLFCSGSAFDLLHLFFPPALSVTSHSVYVSHCTACCKSLTKHKPLNNCFQHIINTTSWLTLLNFFNSFFLKIFCGTWCLLIHCHAETKPLINF